MHKAVCPATIILVVRTKPLCGSNFPHNNEPLKSFEVLPKVRTSVRVMPIMIYSHFTRNLKVISNRSRDLLLSPAVKEEHSPRSGFG
jgi:hypothetical protein